MKIQSLYRNPLYRAYPGAPIRRLFRTLRHPPHRSLFETTLLWGDRFTSIYDSDMGQSQWRYGIYDLPVCEVIARILRPGDCALDIGANVGQMTLLMSRAVGLSGRVESIEPHPEIFKILKSNCDNSDFKSSITLRQCAISERSGMARLTVPSAFDSNIGTSSLEVGGSSDDQIDVTAHTLDDLYAAVESIDLVKVDVEGHEYAVFRGAHNLLLRKAMRCIIFEQMRPEHAEVPQLLASYGYHLFTINSLEMVLEAPICELGGAVCMGNYLALRDIDDARRIRAPTTLALKSLANRFQISPGLQGRHG